jgi:hypothetical protein
MEPRPHERGNKGAGCVGLTVGVCFNGATSSRTWKHPYELTPEQLLFGFNGATSSRTWKLSRAMAQTRSRWSLQWSHVLTNVETVEL